jgi:curved DNA-binding protein CbpA
MALPNYYAILGVKASAQPDEIKQAYRQLVRLYHPDLNQGAEDDRIRLLNEAYGVISNPVRRATYDMDLLEERRRAVLLDVIRLQRRQASRDQRMTWRQGMAGFVRELKKEMRQE